MPERGDDLPECCRAAAEAHHRCLDGLIAEGWQIEGMCVLPRCVRHDGCEWWSRPPADDRPLQT
ncbi:hypothetical protein [Lentzea fradiae]|uniref:hypothetical protein n=1 Tax=Lentzea fradiae TaxID=200378 RepID=UPI000B7E09A0|nr:hypothetical protein [Lentzea fradiae]